MSRQIVEKYFVDSKCVGLVTEDDTDIVELMTPLDKEFLHAHIPTTTLKNSRLLQTGFEEYEWDSLLVGLMDASCLAFIVHTSDIQFMVKTFARLFHSPLSHQRADRKFLYLPTQQVSDNEFDSNIRQLYRLREMDFMPDTVVAKVSTTLNSTSQTNYLFYSEESEENIQVELITHQFVGPDPTDAVLLDVWTSTHGFLHQTNIYPDKVTNLMGKQLSFTTILYPPLSAVYVNIDPPVYDGLEFQIMHAMAKKNNFTFKLVFKPDDWWGAIWKNGSGTGMSGHVSMDLADIGFGAIYLWENEYRFTDYSTVYFRTSLTAVLPKPKLLPGWMVPIHPFNENMWIAVAVSVFMCTTVLYVVSQSTTKLLGSGTGKTVVNMYSTWLECGFRTMGLLVLQVPPDERDWSTPRQVPMRHLVTWLILFFFVVTTGYSAGLASVLTLPKYEPPIETPVEMADRDVVWGGMDIAYVFFLQKSLDPKMRKLASNFIEANEEYLTKKAQTGEMGFVIERMLNGHFFLPTYVTEKTMKKLRVMKEDYVYGHCVYMIRKGSPYKNIINKIVHKVRDTGLVLYWEDRTVRRYMSTRRQHAVINSRKDMDNGPTRLMIRHVTGSFYLLFYGLSASLVIFIFEILIYHVLCKNNTFEINH
ncbi:hypothetical protein L9F63_010320 [Diploptera punctata]|uniref:Uncharacterized protein n=1 Tax=Diploptera punctata TaxID=6984 RepID=A0AAD8ERB0_DIPPU|nr:hypothetical protein L9F63_010320 [Diploptera punctata]